MERTYIKDLKGHIGEEVSISGWVDVVRDQGKMMFFDFRDSTGVVQGVVLPSQKKLIEKSKQIRGEWVVKVEGKINKRPDKMVNTEALNGDIEMEIMGIEILSKAVELPFELGSEVNLDTHLDHLPFTLRAPRFRQIFHLQQTIIQGFREGLQNQNFVEFQAPALVGGDAEGGASAFEVDYYYGEKAYLATSPQFYKQIMVGVFERVFATPKVFRGEKHATTRHLSEYSSMDFEMGFVKDHTDVMAVLEKTIRYIVKKVESAHLDIFKKFDTEAPILPEKIPVLKLKEAQEILEKEFGLKCIGEPDLGPEHERAIGEWAKTKHASYFIFITHYPVSKRPFYTYEDENDKGFTNSFDLLFRGLEITTGGQRIHNHDELLEKIKAKGLDPDKFSFYLQAFKYGMPPHGGSATGLERLTARMLNLPNIKEATLFPRDINRIDTLLSK